MQEFLLKCCFRVAQLNKRARLSKNGNESSKNKYTVNIEKHFLNSYLKTDSHKKIEFE